MKLYEIKDEYLKVLSNIFNEETGEVNEISISSINDIEGDLKNKIIAVASFIENISAEEKAIKEAIEKMEIRKKQLSNKYKFLSNYLKTNMEECGIFKISCPYFDIKLNKCPVSVDIFDENLLPDEYKKRKEVISLDKIKIRENILNGNNVLGARLIQNMSLIIK